ncbi:MAG: LPXTG cell wall anchor domain-containing protein [Bacilli bacterium]|nr:LPXTG cell wall anchor domain-containing protein [Bacilli bacterium]
MKKLGLLILLLVLPFAVNAATSINVKSLDASVSGTTINYNGEMEDGSVAVMCKLYDGDNEIDYLSSQVNSNKFEGSFSVDKAGTYKLRCANYEGGEIKEVEVTTTENKTNPTTGDTIYTYIAIGAGALIVIGIIVVILTRKKKDK